jgi:hypothetical protein
MILFRSFKYIYYGIVGIIPSIGRRMAKIEDILAKVEKAKAAMAASKAQV